MVGENDHEITEGGIMIAAARCRRCEFQFRRFSADAHGADGKRGATADNALCHTYSEAHQSRALSELNAQLEKQGYCKAFPPAGIEVVSWYVMMGSDRSSR